MIHSSDKKKIPARKRFRIGFSLVIAGVVAVTAAIAINTDWSSLLLVGGFVSIGLGLVIAKTHAVDIIESLLRGW